MRDIPQEELVSIFNKCPFFSSVSSEEIRKLQTHSEKIILTAGEILFHQGDHSWDVFILIKGKLIGLLESQKGIQAINTMIPIETIGELGVISGEPRSLTIKAMLNSELLKLPGEIFIDFCQKNPQAGLEMMRLISRRSIKTIKLISQDKLYRFIIIFPANQAVPLEKFIENIKKHIKNFSIAYLSLDFLNIKEVIAQFNRISVENKYILLVVKKYHHELFKFFENNHSHFFMLAEADLLEISASAKSIINHIQNYQHAINEPNLHYYLELILLQKENIIKPTNTTQWLRQASFQLHHHIRMNSDTDLQRLIRFAIGHAVGLVLGGGGMRAFSHLGVIKALNENNIPIDIIGGTSSGACVGAYYNMTQNYSLSHEIISEVTGVLKKSLSFRHLTWLATSIFTGDPCTTMMKKIFNNILIEDLWIPFFCISANMSTLVNSQTIHRRNLVWEALRSSSAIPGLLPPMVINGELHYDGALINNLPVDVMREIVGLHGKIIASQLSYVVKDKTIYSFPPVVTLKNVIFHKLGLSSQKYKFPNFFEIFFDSLLLSANYREQQNSVQADLLIRPHFSSFNMFKISKQQEMQLFEMGYLETLKVLQSVNFNVTR